MAKHILKKIVLAIPLLIGITIIDFLVMNVVGSPLELLTGPKVSAGALAAKSAALGLDKPLFVQYFYWVKELLTGNFGVSIRSNQPVFELLLDHLGPTLLLMGATLVISLLLAFPLAVYAASHQHSKIDYFLTGFSFLGISVPSFFLALLLVYIFTVQLGWLPSSGMTTLGGDGGSLDVVKHMVLPVTVLVFGGLGNTIRYIRSAMLEILNQDYILTAKSKGIGQFLVINKHALRNALLPVITVIGMQIPTLFSGAVIIEQIFSWPGLGLITMSAIVNRDYPVIMAVCLLSAVVVVVSNLLVDILYALVNPKIKYR